MADEPATKQDITELRDQLGAEMTAVEARIEGKLNSVRDELREAVLDAESRLLSAIYGYTETISTRMDGTAKRMAEFEERLTIAERRLLELEKRLLMPPQ